MYKSHPFSARIFLNLKSMIIFLQAEFRCIHKHDQRSRVDELAMGLLFWSVVLARSKFQWAWRSIFRSNLSSSWHMFSEYRIPHWLMPENHCSGSYGGFRGGKVLLARAAWFVGLAAVVLVTMGCMPLPFPAVSDSHCE